jgi:hypothetical protein
MRSGIGSHTRAVRGATDCWLTPPEIVQAPGPFHLDPCAAPGQPWPTARRHYAPPQDGLRLPWFRHVWLDPPYGQQTGLWLDRLSRHGNGIALVFARTETAMFFEHVWGEVAGALFLEGRLRFYRPDGTRAGNNSGGCGSARCGERTARQPGGSDEPRVRGRPARPALGASPRRRRPPKDPFDSLGADFVWWPCATLNLGKEAEM